MFFATDLAFLSPLNDPPRGTNSIHKGVTSEYHCPLEGQVEEKDYDTNIMEVMSLHTQDKNWHGKNKQKIRSEQVKYWKNCAKRCSNEQGKNFPPK